MTVYFIGAGPGDPELITVKAQRLINQCPVILYAGSLVPRSIFEDVEDSADDIIDTAGTLCNASDALKEAGASKVKAYITHAVLSGPAVKRIKSSNIDELVVTNSIPLSQEASKCSKIRVISLAPTIAECIRRLNNEESLSALFL